MKIFVATRILVFDFELFIGGLCDLLGSITLLIMVSADTRASVQAGPEFLECKAHSLRCHRLQSIGLVETPRYANVYFLPQRGRPICPHLRETDPLSERSPDAARHIPRPVPWARRSAKTLAPGRGYACPSLDATGPCCGKCPDVAGSIHAREPRKTAS